MKPHIWRIAMICVSLSATSPLWAQITNTTTGESFSGIQAAIDDADTSDGDTIEVASNYDSSADNFPLFIDKGVSLVSETIQRPVIEADLSTLGTTVIDGLSTENRQPVIWVHDTDNVTIDGFVIRDASPSTSPPNGPRGVYITVDMDTTNGSSDNFTLRNSIIEDLFSGENRARGLSVNVVEDPADPGDPAGPSLDAVVGPIILNNRFRRIRGVVGTGGDRALGVSFNGDVRGADISGNTFDDLTSESTQVKALSFTEDGASPAVGPTDFSVESNEISNLSNNNASAGISALFIGNYDTLGSNGVHNNNILSGAVDRCCSNPNDALDATDNWWGDTSGPGTVLDDGTPTTDFAEDPVTGALADGSGTPIVKRDPSNVRFDAFAGSAFPEAGAEDLLPSTSQVPSMNYTGIVVLIIVLAGAGMVVARRTNANDVSG